ncbi:MAG TPA: hypothetical protein VHM24_11990, partial [Gemmatimonadaceae bacterium]|nr:hypothetical protein [Gemmatimonadaceae bacterium]
MPLVLGAVIVLVVMLSAVLSVDTAYYYPRMMTDQLFYYMKGLTFLHEGTTAARAAINAEPFTFAAMPGLIRVPFMAAFSDFDNQLLAIQVSNILLGVVLGAIAAYLASWVLPQKAHWIAVGFSYTTLLLNPIWVTNMLSPLADLPYALSSLGSIVVLDRLIRGTNAERESKSLKVLLLVLFVISFGCRFTAPVLLVYAWLVWRDQRKTRGVRPVVKPAVIIAVASCVLILGLLNMRTIVSGYLFQPVAFLNRADGTGLVLNTVALAVPAQIIPGFDLLYRRPPVVDILHPVFATNAFDT